ncbi:hypothetical protein BJ742DRAFT_308645 [Cladochytrium replicatum]|nr:hypothetical protein BJ742DRAFT_308645 [Cladochytrium replicatum]
MDVPIPPAIIHDAMRGLVFSRGGVLGEGVSPGALGCKMIANRGSPRKLWQNAQLKRRRKDRRYAESHNFLVDGSVRILTYRYAQLSSEIQIHERLSHPNVVRFYHKFEDAQFVL